jgi:zinc protease
MAQVLSNQLLTTIREELGGTYSISASASFSREPFADYSVSIDFGSDPSRTEGLVKRVFQEIERLKSEGPTAQQVNDVKQALLRDFETNTKSNSYLLTQIGLKYQYGEDPGTLWDVPKYYEKLDASAVQQAAKKYLNMQDCVKVMLMPEKK